MRRRRLLVADAAALLAGWLLALVVYAYTAPLPDPFTRLESGGTVVLASDGTILWRDTAEGIRIPIELDQVSPAVIEATIAAEDQRFRKHPGVDPLAIIRAAVHMPRERSGASTITQQLARRLYLGGPDNLLLRKAREALIATQLEARYSKDEILELYLNEVYYGRGAYGIEAAARVYFGTSAGNLDVARAAFLAGLVQSPALGEAAGDAAFARQRYVLDRMVDTGAIGEVERAAAASADVGLRSSIEPPIAGHFVDVARDEAARLLAGVVHEDDLVIDTTLDSGLQSTAERQALLQLERLAENDAHNAAVVVIDPRDGRILALAGNVTTRDSGAAFNMAVEPRQPGSALKPFVYSLALDAGYTPASPLFDVPASFGEDAYAPQNYDRRFRGIVTLRTALGSSLNVPAVAMLEEVGAAQFSRRLRELGITTALDPTEHDLALALGSGEVTLLELSAAYGVLANGGVYHEPYSVTRVRDSSGRVLYERREDAGRAVLSAETSFLLGNILADDGARASGFGTGSILQLPFPAAVKTGTTTEFHDNWTLGYTPRQVVGVWVGNVDNSPMRRVSGIDGAAPIWAEVMKAARDVQGPEAFAAPAGVEHALVCTPTGLLPGEHCPATRLEWFARGTVPSDTERYYSRDGSGQIIINPPASVRPWLAAGGYALAEAGTASDELAIVQPVDGEVFYLAPELRRQELGLRIACPAGTRVVEVFVNGELAASGDACLERVTLALEAGRHEISVLAHRDAGPPVETSITYEVRPS